MPGLVRRQKATLPLSMEAVAQRIAAAGVGGFGVGGSEGAGPVISRCGWVTAVYAAAVAIWWRWSFVRLWVAINNRHSVRTAAGPLR